MRLSSLVIVATCGAVAAKDSPLVHATRSFFDLDELTPKGPRKSDVGSPEDFTKPLAVVDGKPAKWSGASVGSWACTEGGWDSPALRPTTETFFVFEGEGCVTDLDGTRHPFGPGDTVVLPKKWSGRWDISKRIHKVWVVHDHPDVDGASDALVRASVTPLASFEDAELSPGGGGPQFADVASTGRTVYEVGPTRVGCWSLSTPGDFEVDCLERTQCFHILEGLLFLHDTADGDAPTEDGQRCAAGDTVVLPNGWAGRWNVVEPVKALCVEVQGE